MESVTRGVVERSEVGCTEWKFYKSVPSVRKAKAFVFEQNKKSAKNNGVSLFMCVLRSEPVYRYRLQPN